MHTIPKRITILTVAVGAFVVLIVIQLSSISIGGEERSRRQDQPISARGNIFDRNQRILAMETTLDSVAAWIPDVDDRDQSVTILSEVLNISPARLAEQLSGEGYALIKRYATKEESLRIAEYRRDGKLRGITLRPTSGRIYPQRHYASTVIGYSGTDNTGLDGVEYSFDAFLQPDGGAAIARGHDVFLTIDIVLQAFVDRLTNEALEARGCQYGHGDSNGCQKRRDIGILLCPQLRSQPICRLPGTAAT